MTSIAAAGTPPSTTPAPAPPDADPGWRTGATLGAVAGIASFTPSLLRRSGTQQAIVTALSIAAGYGIGAASEALARSVDRLDGTTGSRGDALESRLAVASLGAVAVAGTSLAMRGRPNVALDAVRTTAGVLGAGAAVGAALVGEQAVADTLDDRVPGGAVAAHAAILGSAALGAGALLLHRPRATAVSAEAEAAYLRSVGGQMGSSKNLEVFDPAHFDELTRLRKEMTTVSGVHPGTRLPDGSLSYSGVRFVHEQTPAPEIHRVMGGDPATVKEPVRIYGGMRHGATSDELAQKIFDEALERGAFDRKHVFLYLPSGSGHVNPMPVAANEYLTRGDVASIAMQYNDKPSIQSLHKVGKSAELFTAVRDRFTAHVAQMRASGVPEDQLPLVSAYGESLGGLGVLRTFVDGGPTSVTAKGVDNLISVGTPRISRFKSDAITHAGYRLDPSGTLYEFDNVGQLRALTAEQRANLHTYLVTHYNDPVAKFSPSLLVQRPEWLGTRADATGIPRKMKWVPVVSGLQGVFDTVNGTKVTPGILERTGHDYRADLAPVMAEILGTPVSDEQMAGITKALNQLELARVERGVPPVSVPVAGVKTSKAD